MPTATDTALLDQYKTRIVAALESDNLDPIEDLFRDQLSVADMAHLLESIPSRLRDVLWGYIDEDLQGEVLANLHEDIQQGILKRMSPEEFVETTQDVDADDLADLLQQMPVKSSSQALLLMPHDSRRKVEGLLAFPEDTAGGLMNTDMISVRADVTIETVLRYLRKKQLPTPFDVIWVVDRESRYLGSLAVSKLLQSKPEQIVESVMADTPQAIPATADEEEVAQIFERYDLVSAPVVDESGLLIGRITVDDVVDVIIETADHNMMSMAGLDEEDDPFAPVVRSSRDRAVWLGINMATAFIAAAVMSRFEASIAQIVALAVLSPVVASMGGIAGSQTLTLMIRGMATGHITRANLSWMIMRELGVGLINGSLWALVIGSITVIWYGELSLAMVIASAILVNICIAVLSGTLLPFFLKSVDVDPALSGSVILTTLTDVFGFLTFLGLATIFLL
ncbi:magnesium transporter [Reinekea blandensis]|uniref:Magnesium transporter MgtE n=1 Tax=Reinekea blandensis MED297 TaxID=314283 RepID=A4BC73_9GAMM|nr:magnesium transporter [Reinekea blandensis]EAR10139.1 magnesium transporter [Reinekea sp. MED297] [Reinekea blandensis MED297]